MLVQAAAFEANVIQRVEVRMQVFRIGSQKDGDSALRPEAIL